jgi:hypothetical protein
MQNLLEEVDELLSRAKYVAKKDPQTPVTNDYWTRLTTACEQAKQMRPELNHVAPDESRKTWAEVQSCLERINEGLCNPSKA